MLSYGLGEHFLEQYSATLTLIASMPERYPFTDEGKITRWVMLKKFPYKVVYQVFSDYIFVAALQQVRKRPKYWEPRLQ